MYYQTASSLRVLHNYTRPPASQEPDVADCGDMSSSAIYRLQRICTGARASSVVESSGALVYDI